MENEYQIEVSYQVKKVVTVKGEDVRKARIKAAELVYFSEENVVPQSVNVNEDITRHSELNKVRTLVVTKDMIVKNGMLRSGEINEVISQTNTSYIIEANNEEIQIPFEYAYPVR
ncbi:hypothetical protein [Psychrobacillus sp. FSL K6-1464]|uniref:hypothetical protein n=1 Tax=Psychrobacillus sp. FSL K6-1464 TaxID=2921545 RepID=UPI0030FC04C6